MILVVGGAHQGKRAYAETLVRETHAGRKAGPVMDRFQDLVKQKMEEKAPLEPFLREVLQEHPDAVIVMDEVGYGIVPMKAQDREYREWVGAAGQFLAKEAENVYRVVCGIGVQIK